MQTDKKKNFAFVAKSKLPEFQVNKPLPDSYPVDEAIVDAAVAKFVSKPDGPIVVPEFKLSLVIDRKKLLDAMSAVDGEKKKHINGFDGLQKLVMESNKTVRVLRVRARDMINGTPYENLVNVHTIIAYSNAIAAKLGIELDRIFFPFPADWLPSIKKRDNGAAKRRHFSRDTRKPKPVAQH